jgi:hypothetical protein
MAIEGFCSFDIVKGVLANGQFPGCDLTQNLTVRVTHGNLRKLVPGGLALAVDDRLVLAMTGHTMRIVHVEFANWANDRVDLVFRGLPDRRRAQDDVTMTLTTNSVDLDAPTATEIEVRRVSGDMADLSLTRVDVVASAPFTPRPAMMSSVTDRALGTTTAPETNLAAIIVPAVLGGLVLIALHRRPGALAEAAAWRGAQGGRERRLRGARDANGSRSATTVCARAMRTVRSAVSLARRDRVRRRAAARRERDRLGPGAVVDERRRHGGAVERRRHWRQLSGDRRREEAQVARAARRTCRRLAARGAATATHLDDAESKWELDRRELEMIEEIGRGDFAVVHKARYRGALVAVKTLMPHDDGLTESSLRHSARRRA